MKVPNWQCLETLFFFLERSLSSGLLVNLLFVHSSGNVRLSAGKHVLDILPMTQRAIVRRQTQKSHAVRPVSGDVARRHLC